MWVSLPPSIYVDAPLKRRWNKTIPPWPSKVSAPPPIHVSPTPKKGFLYLLDIPVKFQIDWNKASWFIVRASPSLQAYIYQGKIKKP